MKELLLGDSLINQFIQVLPLTLFIGLLYLIFRIIYLKHHQVHINYKQELLYLIFICYLIGLLSLLLVPSNFWHRIFSWLYYGYSTNPFDGIFHFSYNLVPTLYKVITGRYLLGNWVKTMLIGNILMFLPLGFLLPLCSKKINTRNIFLYALLIPLIIEIIQLIIGRSFDIDDVLMNFLGIIIGYFIIKIISKIEKKKQI